MTLFRGNASSGGDADWIARSTAGGVTQADRLDTQATLDAWIVTDDTQDHVSLDTSVKVSGAAGSFKFDVLNADSTASGSICLPLGATFNEGDIVWFSYRRRAPASFLYQPWPHSSGDAGNKSAILSRDFNGASPTGSNQVNEVVVQNDFGVYAGYNQDGDGFPPWEVAASTECNGSDFKWQNKVDNGADPLSGTNPDTGSAWSDCEQDRRRYGGLFSSKSAGNFRIGLGDPFTGGVRPVPDSFDCITVRVEINSFDASTANNRISMWVAHDGDPYTLVVDRTDIIFGDGPDFNGLTLLPYVSNRVSGGRKVSARTNNITGVEILSCGLSTATGDGVLEYTASTGRFRWHGASESFGTARGFSAANDILYINVAANSPANSYVVLKITPGSLPGSDQTDTVTIADGRPDTFCHYNDVIVSTQPINAPGGFAPLGVSELADAAAGMSSGDWLQFTSPSGLDLFITPSTGHSKFITGFACKMARDPNNKKLYFIGCDHGADDLFVGYDETTNAWTEQASSVPWGVEAGGFTSHGYDHSVYDPVGNKLYHRVFGARTIRRWDGGTTWGTISYASDLFYSAGSAGMAWFPEMGTAGRIVVFQLENGSNGGLVSIDPDGTVTVHEDGSDSTLGGTGDPHCFMLYSPNHACVVFGGGNGSMNMWKMNSSGTITQLDDIPSAITHTPGPGGPDVAVPFLNPANGNIILAQASNNWHELDPSASSGSQWSSKGGTATILSANLAEAGSAYGVVSAPIPEYGVTVFIKSYSASSDAQMWLWKP